MVTAGYWRNPEATRAALVDGWLHTGDAGCMDGDGYLRVVDRLKDMIITGGENVYSAEVEAALREHPAVAQAAVVGVPDARWGEAVHAVIVPAGAAAPTGAELQAWMRERLAGYKCPRSFSFVAELPLSAAGKVLKTVLREQARAAAGPSAATHGAAPR
jgi:long-chain acyl-CoA synthetase